MPPTLRTTFALSSLTCLVLACTAADSDVPTGTTGGTTDGTSTDTGGTSPPGPDTGETADTSGTPGSTGPSATESGDSTESTGTPTEPGPDLRERGPHGVDVEGGSLQIGAGFGACTMPYDVFTPTGVASAPTVLLAHGFQGNRGSMAGWADHWASWGVRVVTPNLCHSTILDTDHAQNGADLVTLAEHLDMGAVGLAGYSAGGLAAVVAAAAMPDAPLLLGLDMVDAGGLGAGASADVMAPAHGITAETGMCNSSSNGIPVFAAMGSSQVVRLIDSDHCDYQNPGDALCSLCAVDNVAHTPEEIRAAIFGLSTAAVVWRMGVEPTGAQWWTPGAPYYDALFADGLLAQL